MIYCPRENWSLNWYMSVIGLCTCSIHQLGQCLGQKAHSLKQNLFLEKDERTFGCRTLLSSHHFQRRASVCWMMEPIA